MTQNIVLWIWGVLGIVLLVIVFLSATAFVMVRVYRMVVRLVSPPTKQDVEAMLARYVPAVESEMIGKKGAAAVSEKVTEKIE